MVCTFSSCFRRLCTCVAFVALDRKRSTKRICFCIRRSCRAAAARFIRQRLLAGDDVLVVVALHEHDLVLLDGEHLRRDLVQEGAVVRRDEHPAPEPGQVLLEPQVRFEVEVVGRLVQEQQGRAPEQQPREACPHRPPAAELAHRPREVGLLEPEPREDGLRLVLPVVPARGVQRHVELAEALQQTGLLRGVRLRRQRLPRRGDVVRERDHLRAGVQHLLEERLAVERRGLLLQIADGDVAPRGHVPRVRRRIARQDVHERRLPGAVRADQRDTVPGVDVEREPAEQGPGRVGLGYVEGR